MVEVHGAPILEPKRHPPVTRDGDCMVVPPLAALKGVQTKTGDIHALRTGTSIEGGDIGMPRSQPYSRSLHLGITPLPGSSPVERGGAEEVGNRLDQEPERLLRPVHEGAEILEVSSQQMGCPAGHRRLEDGTVLLGETTGKPELRTVFDEVDATQQRAQVFLRSRKLPFEVAAGLLRCVSARRERPVSLLAELDGQRRLPPRVVGGGKEGRWRRGTASRPPGHGFQYAPPLVIVEPIIRVPFRDPIVVVALDFEDHAGLEDDLAAAVLENHDVAALDPHALSGCGGQSNLTATGNDKRGRHVGAP